MQKKLNIVITGGNRGIGYGLLKILSDKHNVIITVRDDKKGQKTIAEFRNSKNEINYVVMDVDKFDSVMTAGNDIAQKFNNVDLLINNAGILLNEYQLKILGNPKRLCCPLILVFLDFYLNHCFHQV